MPRRDQEAPVAAGASVTSNGISERYEAVNGTINSVAEGACKAQNHGGEIFLAERFMRLFAGLERAFGQYRIPPGTKANELGKVKGTAETWSRRPLEILDWEDHLAGKRGLGIVPITDASECRFGAIDIDKYQTLDPVDIYEKCRIHGIPLIPCRSKSGGIHCYVFFGEAVPASLLRTKLTEWAKLIGHPVNAGHVDIFPAQDKMDDRACGNWINMPFFGGDTSLRYAYGEDGKAVTMEEFLDVAASRMVDLQWLEEWKPAKPTAPAEDREARRSEEPASVDVPAGVAADALKHLDANDYKLWVDVGHGLKHSFGDDGKEIWRAWSRTADEPASDGEIDRKWNCDLKPNGGFTVEHILGLAEQKGWERPGAPIPLGYTRDERFIFLDPVRRIVVAYTAGQLTNIGMLLAMAPLEHWKSRFPTPRKTVDAVRASDSLMKACRKAGPFDMAKVRGRGVWLDRGNVVVNLGGPVADPRYVCFEPLPVAETGEADARRLLQLLQRFQWRHPNDALLALGWMAIAPICGVLDWRPHVWIHGATQTGKTTLVQLLKATTAPLNLSVDGGSTEAGIRQALGPDSLPIIIDEFESDQNLDRIRGILRLARSASSGEDPLLRGTPEGRVLRFCLRTTFAYASINPVGMEPADVSRTVMIELTPHNNSSETATLIAKELAHFEGQTGAWCRTMIDRAHLLRSAVAVIEPFIRAGERRHRQNMATLLAGAAVAMEGRVPSEREGRSIAEIARGTVEAHAEGFQRDDGRECIEYLFAHPVQTAHGTFPLGHWLAVKIEGSADVDHCIAAAEIVQKYDIMVVQGAGSLRLGAGFLIKNEAPAINRIFERSKWAGGWKGAIRKLDGVEAIKPVRFPSGQGRATLVPFKHAPGKIATADDPGSFDGDEEA